ncbi:hypothetical protein RclHR1_00630015 [Rhizophagus clarus]|uniref:Shugoshin C-terminal domain-containing protein n=1 Tax=Rhizophagus clarus TaxID=94130 RepID=A0A2Z6RR43_9GLOM|nr:hypothetical protein RclHR1_00630015 [Rhizophagus clarus]
MDSYPYFTLQQKLENIDESLKETVQNYIQLIINVHSAQNNDIIKSNTSYALRLRESEIKNKQLQSENIGLRVTVAQLRTKIEKLRCQRTKTNDSFKESVKSANDKIISLVQQLQCATESLSTSVDPESARGSSSSILSSSVDLSNGGLYTTSGIQYLDTDITEMHLHKKKPINLLTAYRNEPKTLIPISEFKDEQEDSESLIFQLNSHKLEQVGDEYESSSKKESRSAKNDHDLIPAREKDSNLEVILAKKEPTFKQHKAEHALSEVQIPQYLQQHTDLAVDVDNVQLEQKSDCTHETKESVEYLHLNRTSLSQAISCKPLEVASCERSSTSFSSIEKEVTEKVKTDVLAPSRRVILNTSSINTNERPLQDESYEINNFQQIEQYVKIPEKHNKKQTKGIAQLHALTFINDL